MSEKKHEKTRVSRPERSKGAYRVEVRGNPPPDLTNRISELHAMAIRAKLQAEASSIRDKALSPATPLDEQAFTQLQE